MDIMTGYHSLIAPRATILNGHHAGTQVDLVDLTVLTNGPTGKYDMRVPDPTFLSPTFD